MNKIYSLLFFIFIFFIRVKAQPDEMFRGNAAHNKNYAGQDDNVFNKISWTFKTGAAVRSTAIAVNDIVYFGSNDGYLYALEKKTGELKWKFNCGSSVSSSPAYSTGLIYILSEQQILFAINANDGNLNWQKSIGEDKPYDWGFDYYFPSPAINTDTLLIASADGKVLSLNKQNGKSYWEFKAQHFIRATPALKDGWIYIGDTNGDMYALDSKTGKQKWVYKTFGSLLNNDTIGFDRKAILGSAVVEDDAVVFGSRDGFLYCVNRFDGTLRWKFDHKVSWVISSPSVVNGHVITGTSDGHFVQSVNIKTGQEKWRTYGTAPLWSSPLVVGNNVYIGGNEGVLYCIDINTGEKQAHPFCINSKIFSSPVVGDNKMYFGADNGLFYCLENTVINKNSLNRYVYWDKKNASIFLRNGVDILVKDFFYRKGYIVIDEKKLSSLVTENKNDGSGKVIVFVSSKLPASFLRTDTINILHSFIESGGIVVDIGNNSLVCDIDSSNNLNGFNYRRCKSLIGVNYPANDLRSFGGFFSATATAAGKSMGIKDHWTAISPIDKNDATTVLGIDEKGRASAWIKNIGKGKFVQMWVDQSFPEDYNFADDVLSNIERM
ncbi:PQQ-binding-like beta-propeller repeat protein [Panacibacter ginsenosidivorans]|uniref:PQQ-binding-like beta-propeller repeat protein n=1 Tax=Panacibacter ginsenosidivorans TaxID=1813871 RepID=A0A5B8V932_9BACT|nr:PQQ-binding-like beta-propeller repeat protein [Panacibacter ginsenosidivorans]QEC67739.1 PQQ-binding-like beta-propeller repeat protein [Panacibacter ginsenosidivorans]